MARSSRVVALMSCHVGQMTGWRGCIEQHVVLCSVYPVPFLSLVLAADDGRFEVQHQFFLWREGRRKFGNVEGRMGCRVEEHDGRDAIVRCLGWNY